MAKRTTAAVKQPKTDPRQYLYGDLLVAAEEGDVARLDSIIESELSFMQASDLVRAAFMVQERLKYRLAVMRQNQ